MALLLPLLLATAVEAAPPGLVADARFDLALWCNPTCDEAALERFDAALAAIPLKGRLPRAAREPVRVAGMGTADEYGRPDLGAPEEIPGDLAEDGVGVLAGAREVVVAGFAAPPDQVLPVIRTAYGAFAALARDTGGVVEEIGTGRYFAADPFAAHAAAVAADPLDTARLFVLETVEDDDGLVLATWGLRALGLHELQASGLEEDELDDQAALLDTLAQVAW